jgi:alkylation response protein AidB-like acyl-CoA dehydrogenase
MDFHDTKEEAEFRSEARTFLEQYATRDDIRPPQGPESGRAFLARAKRWQKIKYDHGWACLHWPQAYGGRGATPIQRVIWAEEEGKYNVPTQPFAIGQGMCGPTMMAYATEAQNRDRLPPMASGEEIWCQLFSEPAGGSDLANLQTRAERNGDDWVINGQKIWTSGAHYADWGILVTRSDPTVPKHQGLTFFFLNMRTPGIEIKPIKQISGRSNFNEVYFTDVRIPDAQRLGEVGDGWKVSITTLMNERLAVGDANGADVAELIALARQLEIDGEPAIQHAAVRTKIADWYCQWAGLKYTKARVISALSRGETPGPENSITKIVSASKLQDIGAFGLDLMEMGGIMTDPQHMPFDGLFYEAYMWAPGIRVAGGTDEILRNIIAERVLGLPQDIRVDKEVPYNQIPQSKR